MPGTARTDRDEKLAESAQIASLQAYVLVSQDAPRVEVFQRYGAESWLYTYATGTDAGLAVALAGVSLRLSPAEIYRRVRWDEEPTEPTAGSSTPET